MKRDLKNILFGVAAVAVTAAAVHAVDMRDAKQAREEAVQAAINTMENGMPKQAVDNVVASVVTTCTDDASPKNCMSRFGSGWFYRPDGYIVATNHSNEAANKKIYVTLADGTRHAADIVQVVPARDMMVLHIDGIKNHTFIPFADSDKLNVTQPVMKFGSALKFGVAAAHGVVSAVRQNMDGWDFMQTDIPANAGDSGGPVVTYNGKAVGMSDEIYASGHGGVIEFCIRSNQMIAAMAPQYRPLPTP